MNPGATLPIFEHRPRISVQSIGVRADAAPRTIVTRHPAGGWTHAVRVGVGSARIYVGNWPSARAAARAL
jgi:hypothetical protein